MPTHTSGIRKNSIAEMNNDFHFNSDRCWEGIDSERGPCRAYFSKRFGPNLVVSLEITLHVDEECGDINHLIHSSACFFDNPFHVVDNCVGLGTNIVVQWLPFFIMDGSSWDGIGSWLTRADT